MMMAETRGHVDAHPGMPLMQQAMLHWVTWSLLIDGVADKHVKVENVSLASLCAATGATPESCPDSSIDVYGVAPHKQTWWDLETFDEATAKVARYLGEKYGYVYTVDDN